MEPWIEKMHQRFAREEAARNAPKPTVDLLGRARFPQGITELRDHAFDGNRQLRSAVLPASVTRIGVRAFAACTSLTQLVLNEGLLEIGNNAFTGCVNLQTPVLPNSLQTVEAYAFYGCEFPKPLLNAAADVLFRWPDVPGQKCCSLPQGLRRVQSGAFFYAQHPEEVILPEGLEYIHSRAFFHAGLRRVTLPASVRHVEAESFQSCAQLREVVLLCSSKALATGAFDRCPNIEFITPGQTLDFEEARRLRGLSVVTRNPRLELPRQDLWKKPGFAPLARRCATGDTDAMLELASLYEAMGDHPFHRCAANFWRYRAYLYGDPQAKAWKEHWLRDKPETLIPVALDPRLDSAQGSLLRALGFEYFDPKREYTIESRTADGVIEISSWCGTEEADADGFGMEETYDYHFLDEHLCPIAGISGINGRSRLYRRNHPEHFEYLREQAALALKKRHG